MENKIVNEMTMNELEDARFMLCRRVEVLPQKITLKGHEFSWREKMDYRCGTDAEGKLTMNPAPSIQIFSIDHRDIDCSYEISLDGSVRYYSFSSTSGENPEQAEKSRNYLETCATLLSDNFRQMVLKDYKAKLGALNVLKAEYETIREEIERRHNDARAKEIEAAAERRKKLESVGQVWFDYNYYGGGVRYVIKETTEKTILFDIFSFNSKEGTWNTFDTKRISKHLLGYKPTYRRDKSKVMVCPVGTDDLNSQKAERPETVDY